MSINRSTSRARTDQPSSHRRLADLLRESDEVLIPYDPAEQKLYRQGKGMYAKPGVGWPLREGKSRFGEFPLVVVREHFRQLGYVVLASEPRLKAAGFILLSYSGKQLKGDRAYRRMERIFGKQRLAELNARADLAKRRATRSRGGGDPDLFIFRKSDPSDCVFVEVKHRDQLTPKQKAAFPFIRELCPVAVARLVAAPKWQWQPGAVDRQREHIEIRHGDAANSAYDEWCPIAVIGKPKNHVFPVSWLVKPNGPDQRRMLADTRQELDFYLVEKEETDPWGYAQYHCNTGANLYSRVHWSYFPAGSRGERRSSMVLRLSTEEAEKLFGEQVQPGTARKNT